MIHLSQRILLIAAILYAALPARGEFPTSQPYPGVRYEQETRESPAMKLYVVQVDLANPALSVRVSPGGPDPDRDGEWQTTLMVPSKIAEREAFDVCINASFFAARATQDAEGEKSGYVSGKWSSAVGFAMTDGKLWSAAVSKNRPTFWIDHGGKAHLEKITELPADAQQAVQGNAFVLQDGKVTESTQQVMKVKHPRTVVGIDKSGSTLTILTVDGRKPGVSIGMTGEELGEEMKRLGCETAINLDGGGSTELVLRDPETGKLKVINQPSDTRERAVANVVGVQVKK